MLRYFSPKENKVKMSAMLQWNKTSECNVVDFYG